MAGNETKRLSSKDDMKARMIVEMILNAAQKPLSAGTVNLNRDELYADVAEMINNVDHSDYALIDYMNRKINLEPFIKIDSPEENHKRVLQERIGHYADLVTRSAKGISLNYDKVVADIRSLVMAEGNNYPAIVQYISQFSGQGKEIGEFQMTFQETSELVSILPPRAPKELQVCLRRDVGDRLTVAYRGDIDVATTAGRKE